MTIKSKKPPRTELKPRLKLTELDRYVIRALFEMREVDAARKTLNLPATFMETLQSPTVAALLHKTFTVALELVQSGD